MNIQILKLGKEPGTGCVSEVHAEFSKQTNGFSSSRIMDINLPYKNPADPDFVAYDELDEATVRTWITELIETQIIEDELDSNIALQASPEKVYESPWNSSQD